MTDTTSNLTKPHEDRQFGPWSLCVAPMMDWTDRHCRYFHRLLAPHARLYTEMVTTGAVLHGDRERLLGFDAAEHPVALQLGGHEPAGTCRRPRASARTWLRRDQSQRRLPVRSRAVGTLRRLPDARAGAGRRLRRGDARCGQDIPVTVKCRIGVDEQDDYADLQRFVETLIGAGLQVLIVHARKAWLHGLSPKENREIPPLNYERVYAAQAANFRS